MNNPLIYTSMEFGLRDDIRTYSGGLGVLAGDAMKSASDLGYDMIGIGMLPDLGYFDQRIVDGQQVEDFVPCGSREKLVEGPSVKVRLRGNDITVSSRRYDVKGQERQGKVCVVPVYFLSTNNEQNTSEGRMITSKLYSGDRLGQEVVLGIGSMRLVEALGYDPATVHVHMNEGHSAFAVLEKLRRTGNIEKVRETSTFTTHSLVAGHDVWDYGDARHALDGLLPANIQELAGHSHLNMTTLAHGGSRIMNAVSKRHRQEAKRYYGDDVLSVTNGVHPYTWTSPEFQALYDAELPGWRLDPSVLSGTSRIDKAKVAAAHRAAKQRVIDYVYDISGVRFDIDVPVLTWARRVVPYKRQTLLFRDMKRLKSILKGRWQVIYAGKAHPYYDEAKEMIATSIKCLAELKGAGINAVYLENYGMEMCSMLTAGSDVWLNTPMIPLEASGTSGMCAALNGVPHLSTQDGWWPEGYEEGVTGWAIGGSESDDERDADNLYHKLETISNSDIVGVGCGAIKKNGCVFTTERMDKEYAANVW